MAKSSRLGKGLDALIVSSDSAVPESGIDQIEVSKIVENPKQPRKNFTEAELQDLANSIKEHGVIQPLVVRRSTDEDGYVLIAGERRLRASKVAGLKHVPVIIRDASERDMLELALIENVQRADLNPLELAEAYKQMSEDFKLTHEQIAQRVGKNRSTVTNTLSLLDMAKVVRDALLNQEGFTQGHADALKGLNHQAQASAVNTVVKQGLNVRQTEELARKLKGEKPKKAEKKQRDPVIEDLEKRLKDSMGTKVSLKYGDDQKGSIVIYFNSDEELNSMLEKLLGEL